MYVEIAYDNTRIYTLSSPVSLGTIKYKILNYCAQYSRTIVYVGLKKIFFNLYNTLLLLLFFIVRCCVCAYLVLRFTCFLCFLFFIGISRRTPPSPADDIVTTVVTYLPVARTCEKCTRCRLRRTAPCRRDTDREICPEKFCYSGFRVALTSALNR